MTIRNVTIEHDRPTFTEARILETGKDFLRLRLNPHHPCRVEDGRLIPYSDFWENDTLDRTHFFIQTFDGETRQGRGMILASIGKTIASTPDFPYTVRQYVAEQAGEEVILHGPVFPEFLPGRIIVIAHSRRDHCTVLLRNCRNVRLENLRVIKGLGMGITPIHCRDLFLQRVEYRFDGRSQGIIANEADALHAFACSGKFELTDCIFEGMVDDALNVHGNFYLLAEASGNRVVLRQGIAPHAESTQSTSLHAESTRCTCFAPGDRIGVHHRNTIEVEREYNILAVKVLDDDRIEVTLDQPLWEGHTIGSLVENLSAQADLTIERCVFRNCNSHLRIQSAGKVRLTDCEFGVPIWLTGDAFYWFESSGVRDLEIRNCAFTSEQAKISIVPEILPSRKEPYYHRNIRIRECSFVAEQPLEGSCADNIVFENNAQAAGRPMTLKLTNCGTATAPGCTIERHTEKKNTLKVN